MKPAFSFFFMLLICSLFLFSACNKDDVEPSDPFVGKWEVVEATGSFADENKGVVYEFKADGTMKITDGFSTNGTYTRTDTELTYEISGIELQWTYTLTGKTMMWDNKNANQNFTLEKQ